MNTNSTGRFFVSIDSAINNASFEFNYSILRVGPAGRLKLLQACVFYFSALWSSTIFRQRETYRRQIIREIGYTALYYNPCLPSEIYSLRDVIAYFYLYLFIRCQWLFLFFFLILYHFFTTIIEFFPHGLGNNPNISLDEKSLDN